MRQVVAWVLAAAFAAFPGRAATLHAHAYAAHQHPDHQHGPALHDHSESVHQHTRSADHHTATADHDHASTPHHPEESTPSLTGCTPGAHAVRFSSVYDVRVPAPPPALPVQAFRPSVPEPGRVGRLPEPESRAHGPPARAGTSPRAPPFASHA